MDEEVKVEETQLVDISFYKSNGKFYVGCRVELPLYISDKRYKQAIVDKQTSLEDGWQDSEESSWIVVTSAKHDPDYRGFHEKVWLPNSFRGIEKTSPFKGRFF